MNAGSGGRFSRIRILTMMARARYFTAKTAAAEESKQSLQRNGRAKGRLGGGVVRGARDEDSPVG